MAASLGLRCIFGRAARLIEAWYIRTPDSDRGGCLCSTHSSEVMHGPGGAMHLGACLTYKGGTSVA